MATVGYLRVSTLEQANEGSSLDTQRSQILGYCQMKGWGSPELYVEEGVSGSVEFAERPMGGRLLAQVQKGDNIVIPKLDRGFRNCADAIATLDRLEKIGASLHLLDLGGNVGRDGVSRMVFQILSAVAEMERSRIRERIREVKADMKARGKHHGGMRPFGYDVVDGRQVPQRDEQNAITCMKDMRDARHSFAEIASRVREVYGFDLWPRQVGRILARAS